MKFLMDKNSELIENMANKPTNDNSVSSAVTSLSTINGQRILLPEFSHLMTSVSQITSQNFELLKMAKASGNDFGMG